MQVVCCVCGRIKRNGAWTEVKWNGRGLASHGYCLECRDTVLREYAESRRRKQTRSKRSVA